MVKLLRRKRHSSKKKKGNQHSEKGSGEDDKSHANAKDASHKKTADHHPAKAHIPLTRFIGPIISVAGFVFVLGMVVMGKVDLASISFNKTQANDPANVGSSFQPVSLPVPGGKSRDTISIATFCITDFGKTKSVNAGVMSVLASVIARFDIVAIQGASGDGLAMKALMEQLKSSGGSFGSQVSPPVGRDGVTQCFAFVWDESRIQFTPNSAYLVQDPTDRMHFEPMVASFETRFGSSGGRNPFRFTLINVHANPADVVANSPMNELSVLDDVFLSVRQYGYQQTGEEDCILLGCLSVNTAGLGELGRVPNLRSVAGDSPTDTRQSRTLDHILIDQTTTREYTGRYGVVDLQRQFGLTQEQALTVSDHLTLWAEFSVYEVPKFQGVASGGRRIR